MMTTESKRRRLERSPELKAMVLAECERPGASVAKVAMAHGVNANLVHGWRRLERERHQAASAALDEVRVDAEAPVGDTVGFVPVTVEQSATGAWRSDRSRPADTGTSCTTGCERSAPWCQTAAPSQPRSTTA